MPLTRFVFALVCGLSLLGAQDAPTGANPAQAAMTQGMAAFQATRYAEAASEFQRAFALDAALTQALEYLGYSYLAQFVPGDQSPQNEATARHAIDAFEQVLVREPENPRALRAIADLYFQDKQFEKAVEWNKRRLLREPSNHEIYFMLGVIAWTRSYQARQELRASLGMRAEDPGPLPEPGRTAFAAQYEAEIDDGIAALQKAIDLEPEYADAMAYLNLLHREKGELATTAEEYERQSLLANGWVERTIELKRRQQAPAQP